MIELQAHNLTWKAGSSAFHLHVTDFRLKMGDRVALVGPSGAGKSSFLGLLSLALQPRAADIFRIASDEFGSEDLAALWRAGKQGQLASLRSNFIGFVPQTSALLPFLTARENIVLPLQVMGRPVSTGRLAELIEKLDLQRCINQRPSTLSVGQRQRVAVARALIAQPPFILADEPTASVPPEQAQIIYNMLINAPNCAVVMITHDRESARQVGFTITEAYVGQTKTEISWSGEGAGA